MKYKYQFEDNESESKANSQDQSYMSENSSDPTIGELIENIRDKIQRKLNENARKPGRPKS